MELSRNLLFFFSALGAFNAFLLSLYILVKKGRFPSGYLFLGLLLLMYSIRAGFSCLYFFESVPRELIKFGLSTHLLAGPSVFYFVKTSVSFERSTVRHGIIHLLILGSILIILGFAFDFYVWNYALRFSIHGVLFTYLVLTGIKLIPAIRKFFGGNMADLDEGERVSLIIYSSFLFVCLGFIISLRTTYILGPLWFSISFYGLVYFFINKKRASNPIRYKKKLNEEEVEHVKAKLDELLKKDSLYRDANLTLDKLAKKLSVSKYFLSQMLNDNLHKSYADLINEYRIEAACRLMEEQDHYNLEAIAYEVGFNSKSSFFSTFKRLKDSTPAKYRDGLKV